MEFVITINCLFIITSY